jgi:hypothetical protein
VVSVISTLSIDERTACKPLQAAMKLSTTAVLELAEKLLPSQLYLLTSRLSQDCLENLSILDY